MKNNLPPSINIAQNKKQEIIERFEKLIVEAFRFAERSNLDWYTALSVSIFESSEYACFKAQGSLPLATHAIFQSIGASMVRRVNTDEIFDNLDLDEVVVSIKSKLRTESAKNDVIMMLITAISEISGDLSNLNTSNRTKYH